MNTIEQLKQLQADSHALFVKIHNYHWNVKGLQFHSIHVYTESAYNDMSEIFDAVTERALMLGAKIEVTPTLLAQNAKINTDAKSCYSPKEVLTLITEDFKYLLTEFKTLNDTAEKENDTTTITLAQEQIAILDKKLWMLRSSLEENCCK